MNDSPNSILLYPDGDKDFVDALMMCSLYFDKIYHFGLDVRDPDGPAMETWKNNAEFQYDVCEDNWRFEPLRALSRVILSWSGRTRTLKPLTEAGVIISAWSEDNIRMATRQAALEHFRSDAVRSLLTGDVNLLLKSIKSVGHGYGDFELMTPIMRSFLEKDGELDKDSKDYLRELTEEPENFELMRAFFHAATLMEAAIFASRVQACPLAWTPASFNAFQRLIELGNPDSTGQFDSAPTVLAYSALTRSLPFIQGLNAEDILRLREDTKSLLDSFRTFVGKVAATAAPETQPVDFAKWAEDTARREIDPLLSDLTATVDTFYFRVVKKMANDIRSNVFKVAVPIVASVFAGVRLDVAAVGSLAIIGGTSFAEEWATLKEEQRRNPVSFLLKIRDASREI